MHSFTRDDVKIVAKKQVYAGFCQVEEYTLQTRLFAGSWSEPYTREVVRRYDAVGVLPYDPVRNQVVLVEQMRIGAYVGAKTASPWLWEIVAGVADKDEDVVTLIQHEMQEEAGLQVQQLLPVFEYLVSPGVSSEKIKLFCAQVDTTAVPELAGLAMEHEDIRVHTMEVPAAFAAVHSGKINNAMALIALLWLELNLVTVQQQFTMPGVK